MSAPLWLLTLITFSGTLAMHIFVPALPEAARDLGASVGGMQLTVSVYILGLAVGQLAYGPLSDRFGRRPVLMAGLVLYALAGLAAAFAPDVHSLIVARLLQALGGCAGLVIGRAIVRDTALPQEAARRMAMMNLMVAIGPGAAPIVGGALASSLGWRSIFFALALLGIVNLLFSWRLLPESKAPATTAGYSGLARNYGRLLVSPAFLGFAVGGGCATTSMYAFIGASPFIFAHQLNRPTYEVGIYPAIVLAGVWIGSVAATRLIPRLPIDRLAVVGQSLERAGINRLAGCRALRAPERAAGHRADVRLRHRRRRGLAGGAHPGDQRQSGGYRLGLRPLRLFADGRGRDLHRAGGHWQRPRARGGAHPGRRGRDRPDRVLDRAALSRTGDEGLLVNGFYCRQSKPLPSIRRRAAFQSVTPNSGEARCALARAA